MKINLVSDLHLEFTNMVLPGGDILIMAGDIFPVKDFSKHGRFLDKELSKYNIVLYVMGNHEHYGVDYNKTYDYLYKYLPENVIPMEDEVIHIEDVSFYGSTMWTCMGNNKPTALAMAQRYVTDFRAINNGEIKFTPEESSYLHRNSRKALEDWLATISDDKVVVVTHHAPTYVSISDRYKGDLTSYAFASDLSNVILDNPSIKVWCHGHVHNFNDYMVGDTRVLSNPKGYGNENRNFNPNFSFEV